MQKTTQLHEKHDFNENFIETDDYISKSQIKRDAENLKEFGEQLIKLNRIQLEKLPLDDTLLDSILLAQKLKMGSLRRQLQLIGKLLRERDLTELKEAVSLLHNHHPKLKFLQKQAEIWCDQLLNQNDEILQNFINKYPNVDRQYLRNLIRQTKKLQENQQNSEKNLAKKETLLKYIKIQMNQTL